MTWVRLDDTFVEHPKIMQLPDSAFRLHVAALCYSARHLTDGLISRLDLRSVGSNAKLSRPGATASTLVTAGVWEVEGDGYRIHDYLHYNRSKQEIEREREEARERMRRKRSGELRPNRSGERSVERSESPSRPDLPYEVREGAGPVVDLGTAPAASPGKKAGTPPANGALGINRGGCTHGRCRDLDRCYYDHADTPPPPTLDPHGLLASLAAGQKREDDPATGASTVEPEPPA